MMQTFSEESSQSMIMVYYEEAQAGGTEISLMDESGGELFSWMPEKTYECLLLSLPELEEGSTYTLLSGEEMCIRDRHHTQRAPQVRLLDFININSIVADLAVGNIIKPVDQIGDRGFACAGGAYKGDLLSRLSPETDIVQNDFVFGVAEVHIIKDNAALLLRVGYCSIGFMRMLPGPQIGPHLSLIHI